MLQEAEESSRQSSVTTESEQKQEKVTEKQEEKEAALAVDEKDGAERSAAETICL